MSLWGREDRWEIAEALGREEEPLREHGEESWSETEYVKGIDQGDLGWQKIRGSRGRCRLGVRLCQREKDLHEPFLRRVGSWNLREKLEERIW